MDGNRRYAKKRDIDLTESYLRGFKKLIQVFNAKKFLIFKTQSNQIK